MPKKITDQMKQWDNEFGREYTDRNTMNIDIHNEEVGKRIGVSRSELCREFVGDLKTERILEVGTNIGMQLVILNNIGKENLYGVELQKYAIKKSRPVTGDRDIYIVNGSALDIPFKDGFFDLVYTSGLLIHIAPEDLPTVMDEIYRCANRYIWGHEYFWEDYVNVEYRGNEELLWKGDFAKMFLERFPDLRMVKEKRLPNLDGTNNVDTVFLLEKSRNGCSQKLFLGDKVIGDGEPCYVIAEAGSNHDGDLQQAKRLVDVAVAAGADAVKFQIFTAEKLVKSDDEDFDLIRSIEFDRGWNLDLSNYCKAKGITYLATPFDEEAVDL